MEREPNEQCQTDKARQDPLSRSSVVPDLRRARHLRRSTTRPVVLMGKVIAAWTIAALMGTVGAVLILGVFTAPFGIALIVWAVMIAGRSYVKYWSKEYDKSKKDAAQEKLDGTTAVPDEELPWLI